MFFLYKSSLLSKQHILFASFFKICNWNCVLFTWTLKLTPDYLTDKYGDPEPQKKRVNSLLYDNFNNWAPIS